MMAVRLKTTRTRWRPLYVAPLVVGLLLAGCCKKEVPAAHAAQERVFQVACTMELAPSSAPTETFRASDPDYDTANAAARDLACAWLELPAGCAADRFPSSVEASFGTMSTPVEQTITITVIDRRDLNVHSGHRTLEVTDTEGQPDALREELLQDLCREVGLEPGCTDGGADAPYLIRSESCTVAG